MNRKIVVIGLGLIGGSIALAIKKAHKYQIIGFDINEEQLKLAQSLNVIDQYSLNLQEAIEGADLVIVATPVLQTELILEEILKCDLKEGAIITDVGSTKEVVMRKANAFLSKGAVFIGGHPMAGSHKSGVTASKAHLFENAFYIFTRHDNVSDYYLTELKYYLEGTNAHFVEMTPKQHDEVVGVISHFPHIIASGLVHRLKKSEQKEINLKRLAAGGFRDITRIASSNPIMWRDIVLHNREALLKIMDEWLGDMASVRETIASSSKDELFEFFHEAKAYRDELPEKKKGAIPAFYDLYIDVEDHPGAIASVTGILAQQQINLTNIRIIETREDIFGVLTLSFTSDEDRIRAKSVLERHGFESYVVDE